MSTTPSQRDFLVRLQKEARLQADLADNYLLPRSLSRISSFVFRHAFRVILLLSLVLATATVIYIELKT